jgi:sialate O-acetylesterase
MRAELKAKSGAGGGLGASSGATGAELRLAAVFSDHMILQRDRPVPVWGWARAGASVAVEFAGQKKAAVADAAGKWQVKLDPLPASAEPRTLVVTGGQVLTRSDVLVGDVWLASGQSNMEWILVSTTGAEAEIAQSANPLLRHFLVKKNATEKPLADTEGQWVAASPQTSGGFTAAGYYFAKKLQTELKVPVGLVHASWGGTHSEAWTSGEAIDTVPDLKAARERLWTAIKDSQTGKKAFVDGLGIWLKENGREDRPVADAAAYAGLDVSTEGWLPVKVPGVVQAPGLPQAGAVWLRKEVNLTKTGANLALTIPLDGYDSVYWNGQILKQITYHDFPGAGFVRRHGPYSILPGALKVGRNILAIRLYEPVDPAKFTGVPYAGLTALGGNWLAKAEYEFPALTAEKIAAAPRPPAIVTDPQNVPAALFNGMIAPVRPYAIKGVIWYQGESNAGRANQYRIAFPLLITDWRHLWNQGDFSFYFCQLANYMAKKSVPGDSAWAELREAQSLTLKLPHTGQAVLIDIGESEDIHPRNKQDAGERLALNALAQDFGKAIPFSGPVYDAMKVEAGKVVLTFKHTDGGLVAKPLPATYIVKSQSQETAPLVRNRPDSHLEGFAICGEDKKWVWADAKIDGDKVVVWSNQVTAPVAVRYAWAENPTCNLYNGAGLPASPFRTDDFTPVTVNGRF